MTHNWVLKNEINEEVANLLSSELGVSRNVSKMLLMRGVRSFDAAKHFFRPSLDDLLDPFLLLDMEKACERIIKAIENKEKIVVYGDYDVDGTTSVAMMYHFLKNYSEAIIEYYIPDRYDEGYGISEKFVSSLSDGKTKVVITLDCGIRAVDLIKKANDHGVDFVICDHHEPGDEIPNALAVLDPKREDCPYPFDGLSGCGVGFKLIQALLSELGMDDSIAFQYLDLLAISIGADIVPIDGENRILAYYGLQEVNQNPRPGIKAILDQAGLRKSELTISDLVFVIAPRINAAGRIKHALAAVELLLADSESSAEPVCKEIEGYNKERKTVDRAITAEALSKLKMDSFYESSNSTVIWGKDWHKGVIGIVASRLIENYYKPTIVLTEIDGIATGSARSVKGLDIHDALSKTEELLIKYGGHSMAAGLSIESDKLEEFRNKFESVITAEMDGRKLESEIVIDLELKLSEIDAKFYRIVNQFAPFGPKNMAPIFMTRHVVDAGYSKIVGETKEHLKLTLTHPDISGVYISGIAFKQAEHFAHIKSGNPIDIVYTISMNEWNGNKTLQLEVKDIKPSNIGLN